jgi:excisionase family DNA binding protein
MSKSAHVIEHFPSAREAAEARHALDALRRDTPVAIGDAPAPASVVAALKRVLEALAKGVDVAVLPLDAEITTQEAADLLGISRPTLVKLVVSGQLPCRTPGAHRRLRVADVLAFRDAQEAERRSALDELVLENQRLGLYDD